MISVRKPVEELKVGDRFHRHGCVVTRRKVTPADRAVSQQLAAKRIKQLAVPIEDPCGAVRRIICRPGELVKMVSDG